MAEETRVILKYAKSKELKKVVFIGTINKQVHNLESERTQLNIYSAEIIPESLFGWQGKADNLKITIEKL